MEDELLPLPEQCVNVFNLGRLFCIPEFRQTFEDVILKGRSSIGFFESVLSSRGFISFESLLFSRLGGLLSADKFHCKVLDVVYLGFYISLLSTCLSRVTR